MLGLLLALLALLCSHIALIGSISAAPSDNVALVVSAANHHYEVAAFFAYHLQLLRMDLHLWLNKHAVEAFDDVSSKVFSRFTHKIVHMAEDTDLRAAAPQAIKLLVYVTMNTRKEVKELCPRQLLHELLYERAQAVLMVTHQLTGAVTVLEYCRPPKCSIFSISPHVDRGVRELFRNLSISNYQSLGANALYLPPLAQGQQLFEKVRIALSTFTNSTRSIAVQGSMVSYRRRYGELFQCALRLRAQGKDLRIFLLGTQANKLTVPEGISPYLTMLRGVSHEQFYGTIASADMVVMFASEGMGYDRERASSTIPTAAMAGTPLVLPKHMLSLYPCLQASPLHRRVSQGNDCESLQIAVSMSRQELSRMRDEMTVCRALWLRESTQVLREVIAQPFISSKDEEHREEAYKESERRNRDCCKCPKH